MNDEQLLRYSRQILLPQVDIEGQEQLLNAKVLILGLGGLGCPVAHYLAAAGVGALILVDPDTVDETNLQRQSLYAADNVGMLKVNAAKQRLLSVNPTISIETHPYKLDNEALANMVADATVVVDCTDNIDSRFAINAVCVTQQTLLVCGAAIGFQGQLTVFDHRPKESGHVSKTPCYRCLYDEESQAQLSCSESGVLGPVVGTIGTLQALETIKLITNIGKRLESRLLIFDGLNLEWQTMKLMQDPNCPVCSQH